MTLLLPLPLVGCSAYSLGADETDGVYEDGLSVAAFESSSVGFDDDSDAGDGEPVSTIEPFLSVEVAGRDASVRHVFEGSCGLIFGTPTVEVGAGMLTVDYHATDSGAEGACAWDLSYVLCQLPIGSWTLQALAESTNITVTE